MDPGKEAGETVPETERNRTTGTVQDLVADEVVILLEEMEITAEAELRGGNGSNTNPPHQDGQKVRGGGQSCRGGDRLA